MPSYCLFQRISEAFEIWYLRHTNETSFVCLYNSTDPNFVDISCGKYRCVYVILFMAVESFHVSLGCGNFILTYSAASFYPFGLTSIVTLHGFGTKFEKWLDFTGKSDIIMNAVRMGRVTL